MTAFIYAIVSCVAVGTTNYCHVLGGNFFFRSADQCTEVMRTMLGGGNLIGGRLYQGHPDVWYECDQRPTPEWAPVQTSPVSP
jgi:hypothetical protein